MRPLGSPAAIPTEPSVDMATIDAMTPVEHIDVAYVETPTQEIVKAKATLTPQHLTVYDRRSGQVIFELDGIESGVTWSQLDNVTWRYGEGADAVLVKRLATCGCGGTVTTERTVMPT